jgi:predicted nucleotidyltransferase component of viral defense system
MNEAYRKQVVLLIRMMPLVYNVEDFAVHGGTAINLFVKNMPRYSVDIDLTYLPLKSREESLKEINNHLADLKHQIEKSIPGVRVVHKLAVWKLLCTKDGAMVKIEVNGTKRGIIGMVENRMLCQKAQMEFLMECTARTVPFSLLYGGKIAAALSRQHPRDLFDCKYMEINSFEEVKNGLLFYLLGSDKPIIESLQPNLLNQKGALQNQFRGMSDAAFDYADFEVTRKALVKLVNDSLTNSDKEFFVSFESGAPEWEKCCAGDLSRFPSIQWKQQNILTLKSINPSKFESGIDKLRRFILK